MRVQPLHETAGSPPVYIGAAWPWYKQKWRRMAAHMTRVFPILALGLIVAELASLIAMGRAVGLLATLLLILADGAIGITIIRLAGLGLVATMSQAGADMRFATRQAASAFLLALAGLLLLVPGFISDLVAILLLIPFLRTLLADRLSAKAHAGGSRHAPGQWREGPIIEGEAHEIDDKRRLPAGDGEDARKPDEAASR